LISVAALVAIYAYLALAAAHTPIINWGTPRSLREIWWHVTGRQYQVFFSFTPKIMGEQSLEFFRLLLRESGLAWLPFPLLFALAGFASVFKRDRTTFWVLLFVVIADLAYGFSYEIAEDKDAYYLPAFLGIAVENLLTAIGSDGLLLTSDWQVARAALFRQALALDPGLAAAQQGLAESTRKLPSRLQ
jgi:hypothetical protein